MQPLKHDWSVPLGLQTQTRMLQIQTHFVFMPAYYAFMQIFDDRDEPKGVCHGVRVIALLNGLQWTFF